MACRSRWWGQCVAHITGSDQEAVNDVVISPSGSSVFFVTSQGLVPQDTDGLDDVYDARLGEGFPAVPS